MFTKVLLHLGVIDEARCWRVRFEEYRNGAPTGEVIETLHVSAASATRRIDKLERTLSRPGRVVASSPEGESLFYGQLKDRARRRRIEMGED